MVLGVHIISTIYDKVRDLDFNQQGDRNSAADIIIANHDYQQLFTKQYPDASCMEPNFRQKFAYEFLSEVISLFTLRESDTQPSMHEAQPAETLSQVDKEVLSRLQMQHELWLDPKLIDSLLHELSPIMAGRNHDAAHDPEDADATGPNIDPDMQTDPDDSADLADNSADTASTLASAATQTPSSTKPKRVMTLQEAKAGYDFRLQCLKSIKHIRERQLHHSK